jgi:ATP-dependent helicase HrpA
VTERRSIDEAMLADRHRLRAWKKRLLKRTRSENESEWTEFNDALAKSVDLRERRATHRAQIYYDPALPISARVDDIKETIRQHQVIVLCGETGSGKSTQLPKICLDMGRGIHGMIGHTQPRRIAARTIASRVAQEVNSPLGEIVGYKVRFTDQTKPTTLVKLMTDGMLLAETPQDRFLDQYDTLILDEAHERSLNVDFLLGYIKRLLPKRRDLRLIITSATIDVDRFSQHFANEDGPAPVIEVSGRTYPVEVRWRPPENDDSIDWQQEIQAATREAIRSGPGDILIFLPTERDIRETAKNLRGVQERGESPDILPLYARLTVAEQNRVFQSGKKKRRIVLATNVAESSLTVPNITYVIDTGLARLSRYSARSKMQRLPIENISQASADQRMGRCGRIGPGICLRLFSEEDYDTRERFTPPEIRRTNLAAVILQSRALRLGSLDSFPFIDAPQADKIRDGYKTLFELRAIDERRDLTPLGKRLARIPVDPRIGRMILAADEHNCLSEMLIIASALELQDPRERPVERQQAADESHRRFQHPRSDFLSILNLWDFFRGLKEKLSGSQIRKACIQSFLNYNRMREWGDIHHQLQKLTDDAKMTRGSRRDDFDAIHKALATGLLSNVGMRGDRHEYTGAGGNRFFLWPGSGLFETKPRWAVAAELVETSRPYMRTVAEVNVDWLEPLAEHLLKYSYSDPHWSKKRGQAMAYEKATLFGLTIVQQRPIPLAEADPEEARKLLIEFGLVQGELRRHPPFLRHNLQLVEELESQSAKQRERDLALEPWRIERYYDEHLPADVVDPTTLDKWIASNASQDPDALKMTMADLLGEVDVDWVDEQSFPDAIEMPQTTVALDYLFEPGDEADGLTVDVPKDGLAQLSERRLNWLVPGLVEQKVLALIKSLPKRLRRNFVPAQDAATAIAPTIEFGVGSIEEALSEALSRHSGEPIQVGDFQREKIPYHLQVNVRVLGDGGEVLAAGRDVAKLRQRFGMEEESGPMELADDEWTRDEITSWDLENLPAKVEVRRGGIPMTGYPTLIDDGDTVALRLLDRADDARLLHRAGLRRLVVLDQRRSLREQVKWLPDIEKMRLFSGSLPANKSLDDALIDWLADRAFCSQDRNPTNPDEFRKWLKAGRGHVEAAVHDLCQFAGKLLENYHAAAIALDAAKAPTWKEAIGEMRTQVERLLIADFWCAVPYEWLQHFPRYLAGIARRIDKLSGSLARDQANIKTIAEFDRRWVEAPIGEISTNSELLLYRYMIEELRISFFAQELGTSISVSPKRLDKQWEKVKRTL